MRALSWIGSITLAFLWTLAGFYCMGHVCAWLADQKDFGISILWLPIGAAMVIVTGLGTICLGGLPNWWKR
jgi:DMSO/TMAO reductase YedYZ heme-binding membrane subunit